MRFVLQDRVEREPLKSCIRQALQKSHCLCVCERNLEEIKGILLVEKKKLDSTESDPQADLWFS